MKNKLLMSLVLVCAFLGIAGAHTVHAADTGAKFTVSPVYPANQADKTLGYFQLETPADSKGSLQVNVANLDPDKTRVFKVTPVAATTSDAGQINYTPSSAKPDASAQYVVTQFLTRSVTITLAPKTQKTVTFAYQIPKDGFKGTLLGSIYVLDTSSGEQKSKGFALNNRFAMALGLSMTMNRDQVVAPDLRLGTVKAQTHQNKPVVAARLRNVKPSYFRNMTVDAKITKNGQNDSLYTAKLADGSMAPNSNFNFLIGTNGKAIPAGNYVYHMTVKATGRTWRFTRAFTVSPEQHAKIAGEIGEKPSSHLWYWLIGIAILLLLALVAWLFYLLGKRRREQDENEEDDR
jgi:hypothetical protein